MITTETGHKRIARSMNRILFTASLFASASLIAGAANARPMTPEDVAKLESVGTIAVSPDGRMISFLWTKDGEKRAVWAFPQMAGRSASWPLSRVSACRAMPGHPTAR